MSFMGAGSAVPSAVSGSGSFRLRAIVLAVVSAFFVLIAPSFASAAEPVAQDVFAGTNDVTPVTVHLNASDPDGATPPLTYAITDQPDGGTLGDINQTTANVVYTANADFAGVDNFTWSASDGTTTVEANATVVVRPDTQIDLGPAGLTNDNTPSYSFSSPQADVTFECRIDSDPYAVCTDPFTAGTLSDGQHTFSVRAAKGSVKDPSPATVTFTVDATAPFLQLNKAADQPDPTNDPAIEFSLQSGEALNASTVEASDFVATNGTVDSVTGSGTDYVIHVTAAGDGEVTIDTSGTFSVSDPAGNEQTTVGGSARSVVYDSSVTITIDSAPQDGNLDGHPAIAFSSSEDPDIDYECRLYTADTPAEEIPAYESCESPEQLPLLDRNTTYTFDVRGTDPAGNTDEATTSWVQSNSAPGTVEPDVTLEAGTSTTIDFDGTDADDDTLTYAITGEVTGGTLGEIDQDAGTVEFTADEDASGVYTFGYTVSDSRAGGTTSGTATVRVQPQTNILTAPDEETNNVRPTWTYESPAGGTTFECSIDSGAWVNCDGGSYSPDSDLSEGSHNFQVRATDGALADPTPASSDVIIDVTAPDVTITDQPAALSNVAAPTFTFESTDATATFECAVDEGDFEPCVSGEAIDALTDGDHIFAVRSVDPGGNISTVADYEWEVDLTNPVIELGGQPEGEKNGPGEGKQTNAKRPVWYFGATDLNLDSNSITCRVDSQTDLTPCLSPFQPSTNLSDGTHELHISATDGAGNVENLVVSFKVNTLSAAVVIDEGPSSPSAPDAHFEFTSTTDLGSEGSFSCRVKLGSAAYGPWEACESPLDYTGLSSGTRTLQVKAIDSAGNESSGSGIASHTWTTIGGAPDTVISNSGKNGKNAAFGFNSPGNPFATFECQIDSGAWSQCTSVKSFTNLSVGSHTFAVRATNEVGTVDATPATDTWTVSAPSAPNTSITRKTPATTADTAATFEFSSTEDLATFECRIDEGAWEACASPKSYTGLSVASHKFEVRSIANGLTDQSAASHSWTVVAQSVDPPVEQICNPVAANSVVTDAAKLNKKLRVSATISHSDARVGQAISVKLNATAKKKKALAKTLKQVVVSSGTTPLTTLKGKSWTGSFTVAEGQADDLTFKFVRKKGKAVTKSAAFTVLPACAS